MPRIKWTREYAIEFLRIRGITTLMSFDDSVKLAKKINAREKGKLKRKQKRQARLNRISKGIYFKE